MCFWKLSCYDNAVRLQIYSSITHIYSFCWKTIFNPLIIKKVFQIIQSFLRTTGSSAWLLHWLRTRTWICAYIPPIRNPHESIYILVIRRNRLFFFVLSPISILLQLLLVCFDFHCEHSVLCLPINHEWTCHSATPFTVFMLCVYLSPSPPVFALTLYIFISLFSAYLCSLSSAFYLLFLRAIPCSSWPGAREAERVLWLH